LVAFSTTYVLQHTPPLPLAGLRTLRYRNNFPPGWTPPPVNSQAAVPPVTSGFETGDT